MTDTIYQPIATYEGTMADCIELIIQLQKDHPDQIIRMDGDAYAIVGIPREAVA